MRNDGGTPNEKLIAARLRTVSPSGAGRHMSRQELADAVNAYLYEHYGLMAPVFDARRISRYEAGEVNWPTARYREALRAVLGAATDAELGFYGERTKRSSRSAATRTLALAGVGASPVEDERAYELFFRGYGLLGTNDRTQIETAQGLLDSAVSRSPRFARAIAARGYVHWRKYFAGWASDRHELTHALRDAKTALDTDPNSVFANMTFIRACWDMGWHEQALQAGKEVYERSPESLDATMAFARALNNAGLSEYALPMTESVLLVDPSHPGAVKLRIWCLLVLGAYNRACQAASPYLSGHLTDANTRWAVALAFHHQNEHREAVGVAEEGVAGDPADISLWVLLGYLHRHTGAHAAARSAWQQATLRAEATGPTAVPNLRLRAWAANAHAALGEHTGTFALVDELFRAEPDNGYLHYRLSHALAETGDHDAATRMLTSAIRHGFLSIQLLKREETLALISLRTTPPYRHAVAQLQANVDRCQDRYAARLPFACIGTTPIQEEAS